VAADRSGVACGYFLARSIAASLLVLMLSVIGLNIPRNLPDARSLLLIRPWLKSARPLLRGACGVVTVGLIQARRHELACYRGAGAVAI
jgi:hypothetical protein